MDTRRGPFSNGGIVVATLGTNRTYRPFTFLVITSTIGTLLLTGTVRSRRYTLGGLLSSRLQVYGCVLGIATTWLGNTDGLVSSRFSSGIVWEKLDG